ncbi:ATP-dependent Clp protease proteolytic subunit [Modestobacter roseus]|uniref:ATP-dependent Clp protease proteolytic subunit n=2 Tax=Modestobacter roseus TaxID=1181884 RepID=A0A562IVK6_9ACTN|nr:ATP-dependent Clp protease protease subunit [Modestobacter roseus]
MTIPGTPFPITMSTAAPTATTLGDAVYERLMRERIVFLGREVDDVIANELCAQMLLLSAEDPTRDIHLYVNSPGGSVMAGLAVYATMRFVDCDVATYAMGMAASMGQFLVTAGTAGKRYTLPHTRILMHQPSAGLRGTAADITIQAEMLRQLKQQVNELQAEHSGQDVEQIARDSERDRWFSPAEAQAYGLVDHVLPDESALPPR